PAGTALDLAFFVVALGAEPDVLELVALVDAADGGVGGGGRVVGDHVAGRGEADDGHQVAGGAVARAVEVGLEEGLGGDDRDAGVDEAFGVGEGGQPGDDALEVGVGGGVGGVEGPVAAALVLVVVGVAGGVADLGVGVGGVHPGELLTGRAVAPVLDDHFG